MEFWKKRRKSGLWRSIKQKEKAGNEAKRLIKKLIKKEKILIAASLYWAEGAKGDF